MTPKDREAIAAALSFAVRYMDTELSKAVERVYLAGFAAGAARMQERCAKVCDDAAADFQTSIDAGKGEWPKLGYIRDETWADWHSRRGTASGLAAAIRSIDAKGGA